VMSGTAAAIAIPEKFWDGCLNSVITYCWTFAKGNYGI
jgi:hypothetical protein